ncbi:MAG: extracellular solute-binding protein [Burkholderiaceae bacterium]|jgi:iron(III) transport system substrate-binding protein|nr:extracellular solute-binding protein [Burkholderiaceae bacterium]
MMKRILRRAAWAALLCASAVQGFAADAEVNVYSARHYETDRALYDAFTKKTGIRVNVVSGKAPELIERIRREGVRTGADVFVTVDGGVLDTAKKAGILEALPAGTFVNAVPAELRDRENYWIGVTTRARVIAYARDRVKPADLSTYEDLTSPRWKGKVLVRSSAGLYDQSLLASLVSLSGYEKAREWAAGIVANLARAPKGNDRDQVKAIAAGVGDVAIVNTYYIGLMRHSSDPEEVRVAKNTGVFFPNQKTSGAHINISGAGITRHGKNRDNALKLLAYLVSVPAQEMLSARNFEYPVNPRARQSEWLKSLGRFRTQEIDFALLGKHNPEAIRIFHEAGWK